ncbi:FAD dependent oxidoreductase-domain-containing protein [Lactifluus subvellereus]|nr:FAD dependent oxidoreductase-domain-containing protein [Lactifluus subvellereus]
MGNLLSRIKLVVGVLRELDAEYRSVKQRVQRSPGLPVNEPTVPFWTVPPAKLPIPTDDAAASAAVLPSHVDVVVIGSGITGVSCARTLLSKGPPGLRVLVLEARDVCSGATGRNGGHINPPLFHDYVQLKSEFGIDSAKRIIRFRRAHLSALREAVEATGALDYSQIRDVEKLDIYFDRDTFEEHVKALEVWRADMPEEAAGSRVFGGSEAVKMFQLSEKVVGVIASPGGAAHPYRIVTSIFADLLKKRRPDQLGLFTQTPCTGITPPSTGTSTTPFYTVQTPRGSTTARHIIHATNGWSSHLLPGLRGKIIPDRGHTTPPGFDYLTQLPKHQDEGGGGGELVFGGGAVQRGRVLLSEVGVADDGGYDLDIASYVQGALPEYFGRANWGAEGAAVSAGAEEGVAWDGGRVKALWTGILGFSADLQPWVGRVPSVVSGRAAPSPSLTGVVSDKGVTRSIAAPGEWVSAGYSGEGMVHAWLCAHALAIMVLGVEEEESLRTWFPDEFRLTEKRWKGATLEGLMERI